MAGTNGELHQPLSWVFPYLTDWGSCGRDVTALRIHATILRWYELPHVRQRMRDAAYTFLPEAARELPVQLATNLRDLIDHPTRVPPALHPARFALFLGGLADGDLVAGGPTNPRLPSELARQRPGFAFALSVWLRYLDDSVMPWPFWIFPRPSNVQP
jgi:hypothetical protein